MQREPETSQKAGERLARGLACLGFLLFTTGFLVRIDATGLGDAQNTGFFAAYATSTHLYLGSWNAAGTILYRMPPGGSFQAINAPGFGDSNQDVTTDIIEFNGQIYAGTWTIETTVGAALHRTPSTGPVVWEAVTSDGFGDSNNKAFTHLEEHQGMLYAGVFNPTFGAQVWRSATGDPGDWVMVNTPGFGLGNLNTDSTALISAGGYLYVGTESWLNLGSQGAQVWRTDGALSPPYNQWEQINLDGYGALPPHHNTIEFAVFGDYLYAATWHLNDGAGVLRAKLTDIGPLNPQAWQPVVTGGFGESSLVWGGGLSVFGGEILAALGPGNTTAGKLLRSEDGTSWSEVTELDPVSQLPILTAPASMGWRMIPFDNDLYITTHDLLTGLGPGEIWIYRSPVCGNSLVETGETCDDGDTDPGDCCSATCQFENGPGIPPCCSLGACQVGAGCGAVCFDPGTCQLGGPGGDACQCLP